MKKKISKKNFVSFCVPVYNEEEILIEYLGKIKKGLGKILGKDNYEIVVVENGSTDSTKQLLNNLMENKVKYYFAEGKGHGNAYKLGIEKAKYEYIVLSAIDIPFGFSDLKNALPRWDRYDILFGSRRHPKSRVIIPWQRKISSFLYNKLLRIFFGVKIKDTQGSLFIKKSKMIPILRYCTAKDAFFTAQIAIYSDLVGHRMKEIRADHDIKNIHIRKSKYNILKDGKQIFWTIVQEYPRYLNIKGNINKNL